MGAHWRTVMREHGFDPKCVVDAPPRLGVIEATVVLKDMKGAVIGDGTECSGARCLKRILGSILAEKNIQGELFVFLGASRAIVAWRDLRGRQRGYRFLVNGLPKSQDRTMNVVGEVVALRPPGTRDRATGKRQGSAKNQTNPKRPLPHNGPVTGRNSTTAKSLAAQLRSVA